MPLRAASAVDRYSDPATEIISERVGSPRLRVLAPVDTEEPINRLGDAGASYAWVMAGAAALIAIVSAPGQTYGFTFFNPWLRKSLRLSQTEFSATYLVATLLAAAPLGFVGGWVDRVGLKRSVLAAMGALAVACGLAAAVQNVPMLLVSCAAMRMCGPGVMSLLANNTLADWFDRRLGLASGVMQLSVAASIALVPLGLRSLIESIGWREAYAAMGIGMAVGVLPLLWFFYREHPQWDGSEASDAATHRSLRESSEVAKGRGDSGSLDLKAAMQTRVFWIFMLATCVWSLVGTGLIFHLDALLAARGLDPDRIAWATPVMAACMAISQLVGGVLADRMDIRWHMTGALAIVGCACLMLANCMGMTLVAAYGCYGLAQGLMSVASMTGWAKYFGRAHLGRIRGTALTAAISGSAVGPVIMGASVDWLGAFEPSLWLMAATTGALALVAPLATPPERDAEEAFMLPIAA